MATDSGRRSPEGCVEAARAAFPSEDTPHSPSARRAGLCAGTGSRSRPPSTEHLPRAARFHVMTFR